MIIHFDYYLCVCVCVCVCMCVCVVYHFNIYNIYFNGVWNKPFQMDNSLSVIHSMKAMSDHVRT